MTTNVPTFAVAVAAARGRPQDEEACISTGSTSSPASSTSSQSSSKYVFGELRFRPLCVDDLLEVKALHEELFPVRYAHSFYECAVRHYMVGTLQPLITLVAEKSEEKKREEEPYQQHKEEDEQGRGLHRRRIVGVVIAQIEPLANCGDPNIVWPEHIYTKVMYILTLGTLPGYRRQGLARTLLQKAMAEAFREPSCGAVYLHVITYNTPAIRFYEANGFRNIRTLKDYYIIKEERYDSYLYIRHINHAMDPSDVSWVSGLFRPFVDFARSLALSWTALRGGGGGRRRRRKGAWGPGGDSNKKKEKRKQLRDEARKQQQQQQQQEGEEQQAEGHLVVSAATDAMMPSSSPQLTPSQSSPAMLSEEVV